MRGVIALLLVWPTLLFAEEGDHTWLGWFNPQLREVERHQKEVKASLKALGEPLVSQTVPQVGYMTLPRTLFKRPDNAPQWVQVDLGSEPQEITQIALIPVQMDWYRMEHPTYHFPGQFKVEISNDVDFLWGVSQAGSFADQEFTSQGISPVVFHVNHVKGRYVRVTVAGQDHFALAELMVLQGNRNIAIGCLVTASNAVVTGPRWVVGNLVDGRTPLGPPILFEELPYDGLFAGPAEDEVSPVWMQLDLGKEMPVQEVRLHGVHGRLGADNPGYRFPSRFKILVDNDPDFQSAQVLYETSAPFPNPGNNPVTLPAQNIRGRFVRVDLIEQETAAGDRRFGLSEIEVYSEGENVARGAQVTSSGDPRPTRKDWPKTLLVDGCTSYGRILELPDWLHNWTRRRELKMEAERLDRLQVTLLGDAARRLWALLGGLSALSVVGVVGIALQARRLRKRELNRFRTQLAHDLHDEIGSSLAAIAVVSENAAEYPAEQPSEDFQKINRIARETTDAMRETLWLSGSRTELGIDLMEHLQLAAVRMLPRRTVTWHSVVEAFPAQWPVEARRQVFLFFKETLANIVRHSRADTVGLSAKIVGETFELEIRDNGKGFLAEAASAGLGLKSLRQRAGALRGTVEIDTTPGAGTHITLRVPIGRMTPLAKPPENVHT